MKGMFFKSATDRLMENCQLDVPGNPAIKIALRVSKRARRLSLRVSRLDGRVTLTVPVGTRRREAEGFARERADWIRNHLADTASPERPSIGSTLPFRGADVEITRGTARTVRLNGHHLELPPGEASRDAIRIESFLKEQARAALVAASDHYSAALGLPYASVTLRDTRSRWGSCSARGNLSYSWRLIMAPPEVLDYVAAHEVAHLRHMDHSSAFWSQVEALCPGYDTPRRWLRDHGTALHRFRFRD